MSQPIESVVEVIITRQTKFPSRIGFGTPIVMDINAVQVNKIDVFSSVQALLDFGFGSASQAVLAATAIFAQSPSPTQIKVGKREANVVQVDTVSIDNILDNTTYTVTINGVAFPFLSDGSAIDTEIRDGLIAAINGGAEPVTAAPAASNTLTLTSDVAGDGFSTVVDANMSVVATTPNVGIATELAAMRAVDDDFYFVLSTSRTEQDILALAAFVETLFKIHFFDTDQADSKDLPAATDTTSILGQIKAKNFDRTSSMWHNTPDEYAAAAWVGKNAPKDPGAVNWKFKDANGVAASGVTETEDLNITGDKDGKNGKNANLYDKIGSEAVFYQGVVASGEFIDIIRGTDFISARMKESVFAMFLREDKVPYDNGGIQQVVAEMDAVLELAKGQGILTRDQPTTITFPKIEDVPVAERALRFLDGVEFDGFYAGAINRTRIRGFLSV